MTAITNNTESAPSPRIPRESWEELKAKAETRGDFIYLVNLLLDHFCDEEQPEEGKG